MKPVTRHVVATAAILVGGSVAALAAFAVFVGSGVSDVGADAPHTAAVSSVLETLRERSIATRAQRLAVPADLADDARVVRGAGNYDAMCASCHLAPGMGATELSRGLYPQPPDPTRHRVPPAQAFRVVKHGIKASGMPAWGISMNDGHVWDLAAFVQTLPTLDEAAYRALVERSDGHSHGGGESGDAVHHGGGKAGAGGDRRGGKAGPSGDHHGGKAGAGDNHHGGAPALDRVHVHADGRHHDHSAARAASAAPPR